MNQRQIENAKRLAYAIERNADPEVISVLAKVLNYYPDQLEQDIRDLAEVLSEINLEDKEDL